MAAGTRSGRLAALLLLAAILAIAVTGTHGQATTFGGCNSYQSDPDFTPTFNETMANEVAGYKILMTIDSERNEGCYTFTFNDDETFDLTYSDNNYDVQEHTGYFRLEPKSFYGPGYIDLGLPGSVLGAGLFGGSRLYVIHVSADGNYFVALSCGSSGITNTEHVHVFAKTSAMTALVTMIDTINSTLEDTGIPHATRFRAVDQICTKPEETPSALMTTLMEKMGASCPEIRELLAQYRRALASSPDSLRSTHQFSSNNIASIFPSNPVLPVPTHQFSPLNAAPALSPPSTHQFSSINTAPVLPSRPALLLPTHQFSHSGVPFQVMADPGFGTPVSAGQMQPYYVYNPAVQSLHQPPFSGLQALSPRLEYVMPSANRPASFGQQYVTAGMPYYSSSSFINRGPAAEQYHQPPSSLITSLTNNHHSNAI